MRLILLLAAILSPAPVAAQPFSESMMDCAAVYHNAAQFMSMKSEQEKLMQISHRWAGKAVAQTTTEGAPLSETVVQDRIDSKTADWKEKGAGVFLTQEFRDWTAYCKAFGHSLGMRFPR